MAVKVSKHKREVSRTKLSYPLKATEVDYRIYNLREYQEDMGMSKNLTPKDAYEYEVYVSGKNGTIIESYGSYFESYNPGQYMSKERATEAAQNVVEDFKKKYKVK